MCCVLCCCRSCLPAKAGCIKTKCSAEHAGYAKVQRCKISCKVHTPHCHLSKFLIRLHSLMGLHFCNVRQVTLKSKKCFTTEKISYAAMSYGDERKEHVCKDNK